MPSPREALKYALLCILGFLIFSAISAQLVGASQASAGQLPYSIHLPAIIAYDTDSPAPPLTSAWFSQVNYYRIEAGVAPIAVDARLNANCFQHARYMAENNHLTHHQDPSLPYATADGQLCAERGNAWLGGAYAVPYWVPGHSIEGWMESVAHRLWLLYPTTTAFGFGFYTTDENRAGAALDVLSNADFGMDESYPDWPVRYPGDGAFGIPASAYPITLQWRYFGPEPTLHMTNLTTADGTPIPHNADTNLPAGHPGIQIIPTTALPDNTVFRVTVDGEYEGRTFHTTWTFSTGDSADPYP